MNPKTSIVWLAQAAWQLCGCSGYGGGGDSDPIVTVPPRGEIHALVSSSGAEPDSDGYALLVDGVNVAAITGSSTTAVPNVRTGKHSVGMTGLSCNCTVAGANPQEVTVTDNVVAPVAFNVSCPDHTLDPE